jgi:hypothetical protein
MHDQPVDDGQGKVQPTPEYPVRRTFSVANNDVWNVFVFVKECFDRVFLCNLRIAWVCPTVQIRNSLTKVPKRFARLSLPKLGLCYITFFHQEECLRAGEKDLAKEVKPAQRLVYEVGERANNEVVATEATGASNNGFSPLPRFISR